MTVDDAEVADGAPEGVPIKTSFGVVPSKVSVVVKP